MRISEGEKELTKSLSIALCKEVAEISEEELLNIMEEKLLYACEQNHCGNFPEAEYTRNTANDIKALLKLRIKRMRESF